MVNQYQLVELATLSSFNVFHRDVSFGGQPWNTVDNNPQFPPALQQVIQTVPSARSGQKFDTVFRIAWPFQRSDEKASKALTFLTAEYGLGPEHFPPEGPKLKRMVAGNAALVTPSNWSKMKLMEFGFPEEKIHVIPHGVNVDVFYPASEVDRLRVRQSIGLAGEDFVFLNLGAMIDNKGIDLLLLAFAEVHKRHPQAKLVLKDDHKLYRISGMDVVRQILVNHPHLANDHLLSAIKLISVTLPLDEMRTLYGMADVYASPYRAEGFNLPVIEAIACGTPAIVTEGGATDDYCDPRIATRVSAMRIDNLTRGLKAPGYTLEPDVDSLIDAMESAIIAPRAKSTDFAEGRGTLLQRFSWSACVGQLAALL
jgi:glycosyltransferase involved in cell wall biosynthesis